MIITNLGFTAFLILKGHKLSGNANRDGKDGKFLFSIDIDNNIHDELLQEYTVSDFYKFDGIIVHLKKMLPRW